MRISPKQLLHSSFKTLPPVLWIGGEDPYLLEELRQHFIHLCKQEGFERLRFEFPATDLSIIFDSFKQGTLFSTHQLIEFHLSQTRWSTHFVEQLKLWLDQPPANCKILLYSTSFDGKLLNTSLLKLIEQRGWLLPIWPLNLNDTTFWLERKAKQLGLSLSPEALEYLCLQTQTCLHDGIQALNGLHLYQGESKIELSILKESLTANGHYDVYALIDSALAANGRTFQILASLKREGTALALVLWAATQMLQELIGFKTQSNTAVRPSRRSLLQVASERFTVKQLTTYFSYLKLVDTRLKQGDAAFSWQALTWLFLEIAGLKFSFTPALRAMEYPQ